MYNYIYKNYQFINPVGDYILMKKIQQNDLRISHGLYIPQDKSLENNKIGVAKILDIGKKAKSDTKLSKNDYVLYDYFAVMNDYQQIVLIKSDSIIVKISKEQAQKFLKGQL